MAADVQRPRLIELLHPGTPGDVAFYQRLCAGTDSVLEVGCGWGRLLGPLVETGAEVVGVELADDLRAEAARRVAEWPPAKAARVEVRSGDMRDLQLGRTFDRILLPYCGLYCLRDRAEVVAALRTLAAHLTPDGLIAFDGYNIGDPADIEGGYEAFDHLCDLEDGATRIAVYELDEHQPEAHFCRVRYRFEITPPDGVVQTVEHHIDHHYLVADEVPELLDEAGLTLLGRWGDFEGAPLDALESEHQIFIAGLAQ